MRYVEIKVPKGVLFLTPAEYTNSLERGKRILRHRQLKERLDNKAEKDALNKGGGEFEF